MRRLVLPLTFVLTVLLSACPAVSDPETPTRTIRQLGVVSVGTLYGEGGAYQVYGAGGLFLPVERSLESLEQVRDRCFVNDLPPLLEDETFATLLDAGEFIDLRTGDQLFAPLARVDFVGGGYGYTAGEFITPLPFPAGKLSADVPGSAFPAFADAEFPAPPPPVELTGAGPTITLTPDGSFTWTPHRPEGGVSLIAFQVTPANLETAPYALVNCTAADDGEFSFPAETRVELLQIGADFEGVVRTPDRSVYRVETKGDAALAIGLGGNVLESLLRQ